MNTSIKGTIHKYPNQLTIVYKANSLTAVLRITDTYNVVVPEFHQEENVWMPDEYQFNNRQAATDFIERYLDIETFKIDAKYLQSIFNQETGEYTDAFLSILDSYLAEGLTLSEISDRVQLPANIVRPALFIIMDGNNEAYNGYNTVPMPF
jgi:hypothetical protein